MNSIRAEIRVILDTNLLISRVLTPSSPSAEYIRKIIDNCRLLVSQATMDEFRAVLLRFQKKNYITSEELIRIISAYNNLAEWVPIMKQVEQCRDPKDNKFLELAVNGQAEYIITGDQDLLVMNPFCNTQIITARYFVESVL